MGIKKSKSRTPRVPVEELKDFPQLTAWLTHLHDDSWRSTKTLFHSYTSTTIAADQISGYVRSVPGVIPDDHIELTHQKLPPNIGIVGTACTTTDQVVIKLFNKSSGPVTLESQILKIKATRF